MSSVKLVEADRVVGTAWMISEELALTAAHCLRQDTTRAEIHLRAGRWEVEVIDRDVDLDAALLRLVPPLQPDLPAPMLLSARPDIHVETGWRALGFPDVFLENRPDGFTLDGSVSDFPVSGTVHTDQARAWMQLNCNQGGAGGNPNRRTSTGAPVPLFRGASGSPVQVSACSGRVVGMIRRTDQVLNERTLYATPVDLVHTRFRLAEYGVVIHPWERGITLAAREAERGRFVLRTSMDLERIATVWEDDHGALRVTCGFNPAQHPELATALLRLAIHAPGSIEMRVLRVEAWQEKARTLVGPWFPAVDLQANDRISRIRWTNHSEAAGASSSLTDDEHDATLAADTIHRACDAWVLLQLNEQIDNLLELFRTEDILGYNVPEDLREQMRGVWNSWHTLLSGDPVQLQHFLVLVLTHKCRDTMVRKLSGAGPLTLRRCLLKGVAFALLANACSLSNYEPALVGSGNLVCTRHGNAHLCGIEKIGPKNINHLLELPDWSTPVVFLHYLVQSPALTRAMMTRQDRDPDVIGASISDSFPDALLLGVNPNFVSAVEAGSTALREYLALRIEQHARAQERYQNVSLSLR